VLARADFHRVPAAQSCPDSSTYLSTLSKISK
jgi:hypothetical protein